MEIVVIIIALLALPIAGVAAFFMVLGARSRLLFLEQRLTLLEEHLKSTSISTAPPAAEPVAPSTPPTAQATPAPLAARLEALAPKTVPPVTPPPTAPERPSVGLEEKFGTRW